MVKDRNATNGSTKSTGVFDATSEEAWGTWPSNMATTLTGAPVPPFSFMGKTSNVKPRAVE